MIDGGRGDPGVPAPPPPLAKRQRTGPLAGVLVYVPRQGLAHSSSLLAIWSRAVPAAGGGITQDESSPGITHVMVPQPLASPKVGGGRGAGAGATSCWAHIPEPLRPGPAGAPPGVLHVTQHWLTESLRLQRRQPEGAHRPPPPPVAASAAAAAAGTAEPPPEDSEDEIGVGVQARQAWLGPLWHPSCAEMDLAELSLQAEYDLERCRQIGNEPLDKALRELKKFEDALNGQFIRNERDEKVVNHKSLAYAQAAAAVRACAYKLRPPVQAGQLPYIGASTAAEVTELLQAGTSAKLEAFRDNRPVRDSKGGLRGDSAGAAARREFVRLLGVGAKTAQQWWDKGLRTFEDVEAAAEQRRIKLNPLQTYGLKHRGDLLEGCTSEDMQEMRAALLAALQRITGVSGWTVSHVGGSSRKRPPGAGGGGGDASQQQQPQAHRQQAAQGEQQEGVQEVQQPGQQQQQQQQQRQHHDADFMLSHPTHEWGENLISDLKHELERSGRLVTGIMGNVQKGRWRNAESKMLQELAQAGSAAQYSSPADDRLDHCLAVFRTSAGRLRRIDIILATPLQLPWAEISWIGSTHLNRFLRRNANRRGLSLNSIGLFRIKEGRVCRVPDDAPPLDRHGREFWPRGWGPAGGDGGKRTVRTQRDAFEILGLPYREPWQRDC